MERWTALSVEMSVVVGNSMKLYLKPAYRTRSALEIPKF
jgi:hypothetical protein